MPNRVSECDVKEIFTTSLNLVPFISAAHTVVEAYLVGKACHTEASLRMVELWLSAHFAALSDDSYNLQTEKMGDSTDTKFQRSLGMGIAATSFGQQALMLDCSGALASVGKRRPIFEAL